MGGWQHNQNAFLIPDLFYEYSIQVTTNAPIVRANMLQINATLLKGGSIANRDSYKLDIMLDRDSKVFYVSKL